MAKKVASGSGPAISGTLRLLIPAAKASPSPPVGPALGQKGLNIMDFCKDFNAKTANYLAETPVPVVVTAYSDRTFSYVMKTPPTTWFLKRCAGISSGAKAAGTEVVGKVPIKAVYEIAKIKQVDNAHISLEKLCSQIMATARGMGIEIVRG